MNNNYPARKVLIAVEKPYVADRVFKVWKEIHPEDEVTFSYMFPVGMFEIQLPDNLSISNVPLIMEPSLKQKDRFNKPFRHPEGSLYTSNFSEAVFSADLIVCATDPDRQGAYNFAKSLQHSGMKMNRDIKWMKMELLDDEAISSEVHSIRNIMNPEFQKLVRMGEARHFFDYNYAINAIPCFSPYLPDDKPFLSKYGLQSIIHIIEHNLTLNEDDFVQTLQSWTADLPGKGMGSALSRAQIFNDLISADLLQPSGGPDGCYKATERARTLVSHLNAAIRHPDLPFLMDAWCKSWPESKSDIEFYITSTFKRQRAYDLDASDSGMTQNEARLLHALKWMISEDFTDDQPGNEYWVLGLEACQRTVAEIEGVNPRTKLEIEDGWTCITDADIASLDRHCVRLVDPKLMSVDTPVDLADARLRTLKAADTWLQQQYGIAPLVNDMAEKGDREIERFNIADESHFSPAYAAEIAAMRKLHPDWDMRPQSERQADHHSMMWMMEALREVGFKVEYPVPGSETDMDMEPE